MRTRGSLFVALALLATVLPAAGQALAPQPLVIRNVTVIVGDGTTLKNVDVAMSYLKIDDIGPKLKVDPGMRYKEIDGTGKFLIPGLIDARVQIGASPANRTTRAEIGNEQRIAWLHAMLGAGVTTARLIQGDLAEHVGFKHWRDLDELNGPGIVVSGPTFTAENGFPSTEYGIAALQTRDRELAEVKGEDDSRTKARNVAHNGGQVFEISYTKLPDKIVPRLDDIALSTVTKEAHDHELPAFCWVGHNEEALTAIARGCDVLEGMTEEVFSPDVIKQMQAKKTAFLPALVYQGYAITEFSDPAKLQAYLGEPLVSSTLTPVVKKSFAAEKGPLVGMRALLSLPVNATKSQIAMTLSHPDQVGMDPAATAAMTFGDSYRLQEKRAVENVKRAKAAGVPIVVGTGAGSMLDLPGSSEHLELKLLVGAGLTTQEALQAATRDTAAALGLKDTGILQKGKFADMVLLDGDPIVDIQNTTKIDMVLRNGREINRENPAEY